MSLWIASESRRKVLKSESLKVRKVGLVYSLHYVGRVGQSALDGKNALCEVVLARLSFFRFRTDALAFLSAIDRERYWNRSDLVARNIVRPKVIGSVCRPETTAYALCTKRLFGFSFVETIRRREKVEISKSVHTSRCHSVTERVKRTREQTAVSIFDFDRFRAKSEFYNSLIFRFCSVTRIPFT